MLLELLILGGAAYAIRASQKKKNNKDNKIATSSMSDGVKTSVKKFEINPLFEDSHSKHMKEFSSTTVEHPISEEEKKANRDLVVSTVSLGLAVFGSLFYFPLILLSIPGCVYVAVPIFKNTYQSLLQEGKVHIHTLVSITLIACFSSGYFVLGNLDAFFMC